MVGVTEELLSIPPYIYRCTMMGGDDYDKPVQTAAKSSDLT